MLAIFIKNFVFSAKSIELGNVMVVCKYYPYCNMVCLVVDVFASISKREFDTQVFDDPVTVTGRNDGLRARLMPREDLKFFGLHTCKSTFEKNADTRKRKRAGTFHVGGFPQALLNEIVVSVYTRKIILLGMGDATDMLQAARFLQFDQLEKACGQYLCSIASDDPITVCEVLTESPVCNADVRNLLTTKFKYWDPCVQSTIILRYPELLDSIQVITGIQFLTNDVWNQADDSLKSRLMARALKSMPLMQKGAHRSWYLNAEMKQIVDKYLAWFIENCADQQPPEGDSQYVTGRAELHMDDFRVSVQEDHIMADRRYGRRGLLNFTMVTNDGEYASVTIAIQLSDVKLKINKNIQWEKFFLVVTFDDSIVALAMCKDERIVQATERSLLMGSESPARL